MPLQETRSNILTAGIKSWKVKDDGKTEYFALPFLREGEATVKTLFASTSKGQQVPFALQLEYKAKMMATGSLTNIVELLDQLGSLNLDHIIELSNGQTHSSALLGDKFFGFKWRLVSDADRDKERYIELTADRVIRISEFDTLRGSAPGSVTDATSALVGLRSLSRADIVLAGINKVELRESSAGSFTDDFGKIRNGKFEAELLTTKDNLGRSIGYAVELGLEFEHMQTAETELALMDGIAGQENDWKITFADGRIATLDNQLGIEFNYSNNKDMDDIAFTQVMGKGRVLLTEWDAIWT